MSKSPGRISGIYDIGEWLPAYASRGTAGMCEGSIESIVFPRLHVSMDEARESATLYNDPSAVFQSVVDRTMVFQKSVLQRQTDALSEWEGLVKGRRIGLQFSPLSEKSIAKLNRLGIG